MVVAGSATAQPIDLTKAVGAPVIKRVAPIVMVVALGWLLRVLIRRRRRD